MHVYNAYIHIYAYLYVCIHVYNLCINMRYNLICIKLTYVHKFSLVHNYILLSLLRNFKTKTIYVYF